MEFTVPTGPLPHIPDNLTLTQFLLDSHHPLRPLNKLANPWFIEENTGRQIGFEEVAYDAPCYQVLHVYVTGRFERVHLGWLTH